MKQFNDIEENISNSEEISVRTISTLSEIDSDGNFKLFNTVRYARYGFGDFYDPDEHIYSVGRVKKQECYRPVRVYNNFALYLNYPIYKRDTIDNHNEFFFNTKTEETISTNYVLYAETIFDLSNKNNYVKLETPIPDEYDGFIIKRAVAEDADHV